MSITKYLAISAVAIGMAAITGCGGGDKAGNPGDTTSQSGYDTMGTGMGTTGTTTGTGTGTMGDTTGMGTGATGTGGTGTGTGTMGDTTGMGTGTGTGTGGSSTGGTGSGTGTGNP